MRSLRGAGVVAVLAWVSVAGGFSAAAAPAGKASPHAAPGAPTLAQCLASSGLPCYSPAQLQRAYHLNPLYKKGFNGKGSTIVIVDPFGSPTIGNDLVTFDQAFGLPNPPMLRVLQPVGAVPPFDPTNKGMLDKAGETTLDVEWAHAIAPRADILLVETPVMEATNGQGFYQYMKAEDYVVNHNLGDVISQSFSLPEANFGTPAVIRTLRRAYIHAFRHQVTVLAATNDYGVTGLNATSTAFYTHRVVWWPASDPLVTGVGGTQLHLDASGNRTSPDSVWNDTFNPLVTKITGTPVPWPWSSGGGLSSIFARPAYQNSVSALVGNHRGTPDISMSAAFSGAVLAFASYTGMPRWIQAGGTSEATPEFSGIVAIADQYARVRLHKRRLGLINPTLYKLERRHAAGIIDVRQGSNTVSFPTGGGHTTTVQGYNARRGYDLATGIGTLDASRLVPQLARGH